MHVCAFTSLQQTASFDREVSQIMPWSYTMSESTKTTVVKSTPAQKPSVKDSGKVHIGGAMMRF